MSLLVFVSEAWQLARKALGAESKRSAISCVASTSTTKSHFLRLVRTLPIGLNAPLLHLPQSGCSVEAAVTRAVLFRLLRGEAALSRPPSFSLFRKAHGETCACRSFGSRNEKLHISPKQLFEELSFRHGLHFSGLNH